MQEQIVRRKLADAVLDRLLGMLESGEVSPGDQMPSERDLMNRYGVGRPAVREALQSLENMGLITIHHGERARVLALHVKSIFDLIDRVTRRLLQASPQTLEQFSEARLFFEVGMVRLAARRATPADIQRLGAVLEQLKARRNEPQAFVASDIEFHTTIASFSQNPIYVAVSESLLRWLSEYHPDLVSVPGAETLSTSEHEAIYNHIAAHDEEAAARAITDHLMRANPSYKSHLEMNSDENRSKDFS